MEDAEKMKTLAKDLKGFLKKNVREIPKVRAVLMTGGVWYGMFRKMSFRRDLFREKIVQISENNHKCM